MRNIKPSAMRVDKSLVHTKWMYKYHIIFTPKFRRKVIYNQYKQSIKEITIALCKYKGVEIIEGHLMLDHIHVSMNTSEDKRSFVYGIFERKKHINNIFKKIKIDLNVLL